MRLMLSCLLVLAAAWPLSAALPPAPNYLPADALAFLTAPDWEKAVAYWKACPQGRLWEDPAVKPFKDKVVADWKDEFVDPLERELGVKFADYLPLLRGQITLAITPNGWGTKPDSKPGIVLLVDTKDQQDALGKRLSELKRKWVDAGKQLKPQKIRDLEFNTLILQGGDLTKTLERALPGSKDGVRPGEFDESEESLPKETKVEITFGQSGSLLLVSNNPADIERILARQAGGLAPSLSEQGAFSGAHASQLREALAFGWVNFARIYETFLKQWVEAGKRSKNESPFALRPDKMLAASGLGGVKSVTARLAGGNEGTSAEVVVNIPESRRQGLFRLLVAERKESGPPPFVGADVTRFRRWRVDGQKAWNTIETMLTSISPEIAGMVQMGIQAAGKDRDPNFDLKRALIGNLGDDFISVQRVPRASDASAPKTPSSLLLIGSANADELIEGMKAATGFMPLAGGDATVKEHEFLGRKIYSLTLPSLPAGEEATDSPPARRLSFASSGGYAAWSADISLLEEYLRSSESSGKSLREIPGLADAAQKVGGMNTGLFGYQNQLELTRVWFESAKKESASGGKPLSVSPLGSDRKGMKAAIDFSLLPPFERIAKYFHFVVYSLSASDEGISWKGFAPTPPQMR